MTRLTNFFSSLLLCVAAASCTAPIELKTNDSEPVIVIYGYLTEYVALQTIRISSSSPYFAAKANQSVSDAEVVIRSSDGRTVELKEMLHDKGYYQTVEPMAAVPGVTYSLTVNVDFDHDGRLETYEASTTMPPPFLLDSIGVEPANLMGFKHYSLNLYAREEPGKDFYLGRYILNDTLMEYQLSNFLVFSDLGMDNQYLDGMPLMYFEDVENKDNQMSANFNEVYVQSGDKITVCISRIEEGFYDFINQCQSEKRGENPFFGGPASNITTNISNGGVGYFAAFTTSIADVYIP